MAINDYAFRLLKMSLLRTWTSDLWGALSSSGIFSETASTSMDTEDTLSLPESLRKEYHDLRTKVVYEKRHTTEATATTPEEDEGMKLQAWNILNGLIP